MNIINFDLDRCHHLANSEPKTMAGKMKQNKTPPAFYFSTDPQLVISYRNLDKNCAQLHEVWQQSAHAHV
jgi:hypothetical protein